MWLKTLIFYFSYIASKFIAYSLFNDHQMAYSIFFEKHGVILRVLKLQLQH